MREVASPSNPLIKVFRSALAEGVTREGWLAMEGPLLVREALQAASNGNGRRAGCDCSIHTVLVARSAADKFAEMLSLLPSETEVAVTSDAIFGRLAATVTPQGIAALVEVRPPALETMLTLPGVVLMVVFGLQDPGNLGTILRSTEALGGNALITLKPSVSPYNPKVLRACGGSLFRLPVYPALDAQSVFARLRQAGVRLVSTDRESQRGVADADLRGPLAFLIGNEAAGLPGAVSPDISLAIPLCPGIDSLNAAVAAGIVLYEAARQRGFHY